MSIAQRPESVPYAELVKEQQAHARTRQLLDQEREAHAQTKKLLAQERSRQQQRRKLWKTPFKPAEKAMIEELQRQVEHPVQQDPDGFTRVCFETAAINIGMSSNTPRRTIENLLAQCPDFPIETREVKEPNPKGKGTIPRLYVRPKADLIAAAPALVLEHQKKQGGNQYQCQRCLSHNVMIKRQLVCLDCGHSIDLDPTFPNGKIKQNSGKSGKTNLVLLDNASNTAQVDNDQDGQHFTQGSDQDNQADSAQDSETGTSGKTNLVLLPPAPLASSDSETPAGPFFAPDGSKLSELVITSDPPHSDSLNATAEADEESAISTEEAQDITAAAELLLAIAGDAEVHIEMSRAGEKKYYTVPRRLQFFDLVDHLRGGQARGALCSYQDGSTRALIFDTDEPEEWAAWKVAARKLVEAGYMVLLDESPAGRGGHLLIIFDAPVLAAAARAAVLAIAPELADCPEYWPGPQAAKNWNRVRLPGAFYARYGKHVERPIKAWCRLTNVTTGETASDGISAARLLLASMTPAEIVPALPPISDQDEEAAADLPTTGSRSAHHRQPICPPPAADLPEEPAADLPTTSQGDDQAAEMVSAGAGPRLPKVDERWMKDHGPVERTTLWFAIIEEYAAAWFNEHNPLESISPRQQNRMAYSPNGNERTPSTSYYQTAQGERFTDHSTHGRRSDGSKDSGDALELACKVWQRDKGSILAETTRAIVKQARAELESAARAGQPLPAWIEEIVTPAGRRKYAELLAKREKASQDGQRRKPGQLGAGSSDVSKRAGNSTRVPAPARGEDREVGAVHSQPGGNHQRAAGQPARNGTGKLCEGVGENHRSAGGADTAIQTDASPATTPLAESGQAETPPLAPAALVTELRPTQGEAPTIHSQEPEPAPAPAIQDQDDQTEARNLATQTSSQRQQQPEPERRHIGTCLVEEYGTGKPCGSTQWWPSREEEYVCAKCLSPIAWTRRIEAQRAK